MINDATYWMQEATAARATRDGLAAELREIRAQGAELAARRFAPERELMTMSCVAHAAVPVLERPAGCLACMEDIRVRLGLSFTMLGWLQNWRADATRLLRPKGAAGPEAGDRQGNQGQL